MWLLPVGLVLLALVVWWVAAAPRREIRRAAAEPIRFDPATERAVAAVDRSAAFSAALEQLPSDLPPYDDAEVLADGRTALATAHDGKIWKLDLATHTAERTPQARAARIQSTCSEAAATSGDTSSTSGDCSRRNSTIGRHTGMARSAAISRRSIRSTVSLFIERMRSSA